MISIDKLKMPSQLKTFLTLFIIWAVAVYFNITKAVYIDDISTINIGNYLLADLGHPLTAILQNVTDSGIPLERSVTHPPFIPYLSSLIIHLFGRNDLAFHAVWSLFTLISVVFFYLLARQFTNRALLLTFLFIISPVFIPSQNLMLDIPLVSLIILFFYFLLNKRGNLITYLAAGTTAGLAFLIEYSGLLLLSIFAVYIFLNKKYKLMWILVIPAGLLLLWSVFNYFELGGIHLLSTNASGYGLKIWEKALLWIIILGSVSPFSLLFLTAYLRQRKNIMGFAAILLISFLMAVKFLMFPGEDNTARIMRNVFFTNGMLTAVISLIASYKALTAHLRSSTVAVWYLAGTILMIVSVPFMAVRHLLIVMPALLLLAERAGFISKNRLLVITTVLLTIMLTAVLSYTDVKQAESYKRGALEAMNKIRRKYGFNESYNVWSGGFYGWRYYAENNGFKPYNPDRDDMKKDDFLVLTSLYPQSINPAHQKMLDFDFEFIIPRNKFSFISTMTNWPNNAVGYYYLPSIKDLPYQINPDYPLEKFSVYRAVREE